MRLICAVALFTLSFASGCASTIGNVSDLKQVTFEIGTTHKSEVADTLGFPESRATDQDLEYWGYRSKPQLSGVIYAVPTAPNTVSTMTTTINNGRVQMDNAAVIYTFDATGTLTHVQEQTK